MKRTSILAVLVSTVLLASLGCGSPARGNLQTVAVTAGSNKLVGEGGTVQLQVLANFGKETDDVTTSATYVVTPNGNDLTGQALPNPPQTITINSTGMLTAVPPFVCTFHDASQTTTPAWVLVGSYQIVAKFRGVVSQPFFVAVASAAGDGPNDACGP